MTEYTKEFTEKFRRFKQNNPYTYRALWAWGIILAGVGLIMLILHLLGEF